MTGLPNPNPTRVMPQLSVRRGREAIEFYMMVEDPRATVQQAVDAGAREVWPVSEEYGWLLGRVVDPFGHHWEVGRPPKGWPDA